MTEFSGSAFHESVRIFIRMNPFTIPSAIGASAPPVSTRSARPDWINRIEYPIASVEEVQPVVITWLGPRNSKRMLRSDENVPITPVGTQNKLIRRYS